jgi:hypothetical protein
VSADLIARLFYAACCLAAIYAIFHLQRYRHLKGDCSPYCAYTLVAFAIAWEMIDAWKFGAPGFPSSRWLLVPMLTFSFGWEAWMDLRQRRRRTRRSER